MVVAVAVAVAVAEKNKKLMKKKKTEKLAEIGQMLRAVRVSGEGGEGSWALTTVSDLSIKKTISSIKKQKLAFQGDEPFARTGRAPIG